MVHGQHGQCDCSELMFTSRLTPLLAVLLGYGEAICWLLSLRVLYYLLCNRMSDIITILTRPPQLDIPEPSLATS